MGVFRSLTRTWYRLKNLPGKIDPHSIRSIVFFTKMKILIVATYVDRVSCKFHYFDLTKYKWKTRELGLGCVDSSYKSTNRWWYLILAVYFFFSSLMLLVSYLHQRNRLGNSSTVLWTA